MADEVKVQEVHSEELAILDPPPAVTDPTQGRVQGIAKALEAAYARASTLQLTTDESAAIQADFPDEAVRSGAGGKANLLYIEHAYTRQRLHEVFGPGQWSLIMRRMWTEDYQTSKGDPAVRVYAECVLLVRGCFVGESIGAMAYYPHNAEQNLSDAVEGAQSEALRRIAGKCLGIGLQVWKKSFCEGWHKRWPRGNAVQMPNFSITEEEAEELERLIRLCKIPLDKFLLWAKEMLAKSGIRFELPQEIGYADLQKLDRSALPTLMNELHRREAKLEGGAA